MLVDALHAGRTNGQHKQGTDIEGLSLRVECLDSPQCDFPCLRGLSVKLRCFEELCGSPQVSRSVSSFAGAEITQVHDCKGLNRRQVQVIMRQHFSTGLVHEVLAQRDRIFYIFINVAGFEQMAGHCAYGVDEGGGAVSFVVGSKAFFEVEFTEQHVHWMNPGEVQVEQVAQKGPAGAHLSPIVAKRIRLFAAAAAVFSMVVVFEGVHNMEQTAFLWWDHVQTTWNGLLLAKPPRDRFARLATAQFSNYFAVMSISPNLVEHDLLPFMGVLKALVLLLEVGGSAGELLVDTLETIVVFAEIGDLLQKEFLVGFGVRLVMTIELASLTPSTGFEVRSITPITLENDGFRYVSDLCPNWGTPFDGRDAEGPQDRMENYTFCRAFLHSEQAMVATVPGVLRFLGVPSIEALSPLSARARFELPPLLPLRSVASRLDSPSVFGLLEAPSVEGTIRLCGDFMSRKVQVRHVATRVLDKKSHTPVWKGTRMAFTQ